VDIEDLTLTIPVPSYIPRARGVHAVGKFNSYITVYLSKDERDLLNKACETLGLSRNAYARWVLVHTAIKALEKEGIHVSDDEKSWAGK